MEKAILNDHLYAHMLESGREPNKEHFEHRRKNVINLDAFALKDKKNNNNFSIKKKMTLNLHQNAYLVITRSIIIIQMNY